MMSLPAAKDLRAQVDRVIERAARSGRPRDRFLREQRRRLVSRLLPTLALLAVATGAAAVVDLFRDTPRYVTIAQGLTAVVLAALAFVSTLLRKNRVVLTTMAFAGA